MNDLHIQRYAGGVLLTQRNAAVFIRAADLYDVAARLSRLREEIRHDEPSLDEEIRHDEQSLDGEDREPDPQHVDAARPLGFASAVFLAWDIIGAGYQVEALSCREDGGRVDWYILFLGDAWDSRVYQVRSAAEWEQWRREHTSHRGAG